MMYKLEPVEPNPTHDQFGCTAFMPFRNLSVLRQEEPQVYSYLQVMREFHRNNQPHFQQHRTQYSITLLIYDALPLPVLKKFQQHKIDTLLDIEQDDLPDKPRRKTEARMKFDHLLEELLDQHSSQSHALKNERAATAVADYLHKYDGVLYTLHAYSVMSNHIHLLFDLEPQLEDEEEDPAVSLDKVIGRIKGGSGRMANIELNRSGKFWMFGYHDRYIRSIDHFTYAYEYILNNPVKAKLVVDRADHKWTWGRLEGI